MLFESKYQYFNSKERACQWLLPNGSHYVQNFMCKGRDSSIIQGQDVSPTCQPLIEGQPVIFGTLGMEVSDYTQHLVDLYHIIATMASQIYDNSTICSISFSCYHKRKKSQRVLMAPFKGIYGSLLDTLQKWTALRKAFFGIKWEIFCICRLVW